MLYREATPFLPQDAQLPLGRRHQGAVGLAQAARLHRLLPADGRADLHQRARCRSSPTRTTPRSRCRCGRATSSPVARRSRSTRSTPSEMKQVLQARRLAGPVPPQARPDLPAARRPRLDHLRQRQALRRPVGAHRPRRPDQPRQRHPRDARPHPRPHDQAPPRLRPRAPGPDGAAPAPTPAARLDSPAGADGRPATVVTIGGLSKDSDPGLAAIVTAITTGVHDRLAERTDRS